MQMSGLKRALPLSLAFFAMLWVAQGAAPERNKPGEFDYYVLVLGWSPTYCESDGRDRNDRQCDTTKPRTFVLHGLWPQYDKGWPQDCRTKKRPWVPRAVIEEMADIMPSSHLVIHEYRAHGTCSGLEPDQFFGIARELYERVSVPARFAVPAAELSVSPEELEADFVSANSWLRPEMMSVTCRGRELLDVRFCFGRDLFPRSCGANEDQHLLCGESKVTVPPTSGR
jgi:ribonuclease T2